MLLSGNLQFFEILVFVIAILISLTAHELAHAYAALRLGDDTPLRMGRITLNPLAHIDPIGFLLLLTAGFGWAKPVLIDPRNLKKPARDDAIIALAGPGSNFLLAVILTVILKVIVTLFGGSANQGMLQNLVFVFFAFIQINLVLLIFNLIPIPPLDGSHLLGNYLSSRNRDLYIKYYRYGSTILLAIILSQRFTGIDVLPIGKAVSALMSGLFRLFGLT